MLAGVRRIETKRGLRGSHPCSSRLTMAVESENGERRWAVRSWQAASDLELHMRGRGPLAVTRVAAWT